MRFVVGEDGGDGVGRGLDVEHVALLDALHAASVCADVAFEGEVDAPVIGEAFRLEVARTQRRVDAQGEQWSVGGGLEEPVVVRSAIEQCVVEHDPLKHEGA